MTEATPSVRHGARADVLRCTSTGAFATLWLFVLCWIAIALGTPVGATHAFAALFTMQPAGSVTALWTGGLWAFIAGGVAGLLVAHCYNLAGRVLGR